MQVVCKKEMVGAIARGVQTVNSKFLKAVLGKGYHPPNSARELSKIVVRADGREEDGHGVALWVPHHRTGIYYPLGQEKVMEDIPTGGACLAKVHWASSYTENEPDESEQQINPSD
ncbi:hypothetical protein AQUCO_09600009v1 [Aquilegia coerulea]|uniref:Uncharacterized protein n=1 Tax=Aquilegia coerulea TaxID=218851 RepID=A0A2G5C4I6_AQUCA|nr:hypothetical protein AQUCO_09600009v1 [Aquilegia coerulea]